MIFLATPLKNAYVIQSEPFRDLRGEFMRTFCANEFAEHGLINEFVQCNLSITKQSGVIRGMHYQVDGSEEDKLVRCIRGSILDVIIDLRRDSESYGKHFSVELSESNAKALFIPRGFAHGFLTVDGPSYVYYQMSNFYSPGKERGIRWNDPMFNIPWPVSNPVLSERDANYEDFRE